MSIDHTTQKPTIFFWLKPSHRTWPEQWVGASIFLLLGLLFEWISRVLVRLSLTDSSISARWGWIICNLLVAAAIWHLWRRYSLTKLKLEFSLFLSQFVLQIGWSLTIYFHEALLSLIALLFLSSNAILSALLFWKKERIGGQMWIFSILWILYLVGINMMICIANPPRIH